MFDFVAARKKMVENQLRTNGITDHRLLAVMAQVPRELFVPEAKRELAYIDEPHLVSSAGGDPRYLPAPAPFARMVQLARIETDDAVLDIGCTTGYTSAVLARLADKVVAVENESDLAAAARANLAALSLGEAVAIVEGPLEAGAPHRGPYDVVVVEGAVETPPAHLFPQLKEGGRLVALLRHGRAATVHLYVKSGTDVAGRAEFNTILPPLSSVKGRPEFVF